jgi:hypothetical protein
MLFLLPVVPVPLHFASAFGTSTIFIFMAGLVVDVAVPITCEQADKDQRHFSDQSSSLHRASLRKICAKKLQ